MQSFLGRWRRSEMRSRGAETGLGMKTGSGVWRALCEGSLIPIDPKTGKPGPAIHVDDPYNLYFTPDGGSAVVVAERLRRLDFRDPHDLTVQVSLAVPDCAGVNHADFSADGSYAIFTC